MVSSWKETWKRGLRDRSRSRPSSATTCSNGRSAWENAASASVLTLRSSSAKDGSPPRSVRSTTVLTNSPIRPFSRGSPRPLTGVPTAMSVRPVSRPRVAWKAASSTMNRVARCCRASRSTPAASSAGMVNRTMSAAPSQTAGRGRSVGSVSDSRPASRSRQWARWRSPRGPASRPTCSAAASAYWKGSGSGSATAAGLPVRARYPAASSRVSTAQEEKSKAMWWTTISRS